MLNRNRLYILVIACSIGGFGWLAWDAASTRSSGAWAHSIVTSCPVKLATGIPCPSCGTTRAVVALAAGDVAGSLQLNPFGLLIAFALIVFPPWVLHDVIRSRDGFHRFYLAFERTLRGSRALALSSAALVIANWGWNILKGF